MNLSPIPLTGFYGADGIFDKVRLYRNTKKKMATVYISNTVYKYCAMNSIKINQKRKLRLGF